jgi:type I restriction enzyme S subunit
MPDVQGSMARTTIGHLLDAGAISIATGFPCGEHNSDGQGVLHVRPYNVTPQASIVLEQQKHVPSSAAQGKPTLVAGDVLFNNTNTKELVGKTALWNGPENCVFSNHMTRIRISDPTIPPRYLANAIHAHWLTGRSQMLARAHVAQASILGERFREIELPWPSPAEQAAFARIFDVLDASLALETKVAETALGLKRAAMRTLFARGLRGEAQKETEIGALPESWSVVVLGSVGRVGNGSTPKKSVRAYWDGGDFPWLTSAKVYDRDIVAADQFVTPTALKECHLPVIEPGAILMAITGQGKTLGHCAVLRMRATINQHIAYIATDLERGDPSFIRGYLETQYDYFRQVGAGGGSTKGALTCAFLRSVPIPLPPTLEEQREIVAILDAIDRKIDLHKRKLAVLDELFNALLHKLMIGEIRVADLDLSALASPKELEAAE